MQIPIRTAALRLCVIVGAICLCAGARADDWNWNWQHDDNQYRNEYRGDRNSDRQGNGNHQDYNNRQNYNRGGNQDVTERQKRACEPDVFRLCGWYIPNRDRITACLRRKIDHLNPDCRAVMEGQLR